MDTNLPQNIQTVRCLASFYSEIQIKTSESGLQVFFSLKALIEIFKLKSALSNSNKSIPR